MLILDRDGARLGNGWDDRTAGRTPTTIDLPADLVLRDSAVIDRPIDAVFDRVRQVVLELRLHPVSHTAIMPERGDAGWAGAGSQFATA